MYNKKQNSDHPWRNKLNDPGHFPESEMVDKNAAWLKLQEKLSEGKRHNKPFWYWAAAACLLISISLTMLITNKNGSHQQNIVSRKKEIIAPNLPLTPAANSNQENKIETIVNIQNRRGKLEARLSMGSSKVDKKQLETILLPDSNLEKEAPLLGKAPNNIATKNEADSSHPIAIVDKEKKKMRVLHINELDKENNIEPPAQNIGHRNTAFNFSIGYFDKQQKPSSSNIATLQIFSK